MTNLRVYRVWVDGQKTSTVEIVEATSGFQARQAMATKYGKNTFEIVSVWLKETSL